MIGLLAYVAWLSAGVPTGVEVQGRGFKEFAAPATPNLVRGEALYVAKCAACHGADGQACAALTTLTRFHRYGDRNRSTPARAWREYRLRRDSCRPRCRSATAAR